MLREKVLMEKQDAPTIAQAGFAAQFWDIIYFCEKWQIENADAADFFDWYIKFSKKEYRKAKKIIKRKQILDKELEHENFRT